MHPQPGQNLLHYRITEKIGEGGMGVVWKARDTTLDRDVAIKVLPEAFSSDPERLTRFEREARLLASLNHPNVAGIYGLHEAEGLHFLAMEYVEGEDLSQTLERGPLSLEGTLKVARQIAMALESAHSSGIVHRDLKPANIRLTPAGAVKVLDLGLAKAMAPDSGSRVNLSLSPTLTSKGTVAGMIMGTAAYMSPEQARGGVVDQRTDIWAAGCVIFEMLTCHRLFSGDTVSDSIAAILKNEPPWERLPAETPWLLRRVLQRCLVKDADQRLHSMADLRLELQDVSAPLPAAGEAPAAAGLSRMPRWAAATMGVLALAVAGLAALQLHAPEPGLSAAAPDRVTVSHQTFYAGQELSPTLSRDGTYLAYSATEGEHQDIFLERVGGSNPINLTHSSGTDDITPAFSPDGESIAFRSGAAAGGVFVMGATGESLRRLTDDGFDPAWSPDGTQIVYAKEGAFDPLSRSGISSLHIVDIKSGESRKIYDGDAVQPSWSPGGHRIACWGFIDEEQRAGQRDIFTIRPDGTDRVSITDDAQVDWNPVWAPDGRHLYFVSDRGGSMNLWRVPMDENSGQVLGDLEPVQVPSAWAGFISVAAGGKLAYLSRDMRSNVHRVPLDAATLKATGPAQVVTRGTLALADARLSPDGEWLAFKNYGIQEDLYLVRSDGGGLRKLTDDAHRDRGPSWTPDGEEIVFYSTRSGSYQLWSIRKDGSGARPLTNLDGFFGSLWYPSISPDGARLAAYNGEGTWIFELGGDKLLTFADGLEMPPAGPEKGRFSGALHWSADSRHLGGTVVPRSAAACAYDLKAGEYRFIASAQLQEPQSIEGWLADGRALVLDKTGLFAVQLDTGKATPVAPSLGLDKEVSTQIVTPDARWLYRTVRSTESDIWIATTR